MHLKPAMWTLQPQLTAAPNLWRGVQFFMPYWEGTGRPWNIMQGSNGRDPNGSGTLTWVLTDDGRGVDYSSGYQKWINADQLFIGADEFTAVFVIQSDATNTDKGWFITETPDGSGGSTYMRYDASGFNGGQSNVINFGIETTGGAANMESSGGVQTTDTQHLVMRWKSGIAPELFIDGVQDTPSYNSGAVTGTLGGDGWVTYEIGRSAKDSGGTTWDGKILFHCAATRYWTDDDIWAHYRNPNIMLRPAGF